MKNEVLIIAILIVAILLYYVTLYFLTRFLFKIFSLKKTWIGYIIVAILFSIPVFCIIDYLHRGNSFVEMMSFVGYCLAGFLLYFLLVLCFLALVMSIFYLLTKRKDFKNLGISKWGILFCAVTSFVICTFGVVSAQVPVETNIDIDFGGNTELKIVALSDIHYGSTGSFLSLERMVEQINQLEADVVVLVGDVFDNDIQNLNQLEFSSQMKKIKSKFGVYAISGNHEFGLNSYEDVISFYRNSNIQLLMDQEVVIDRRIRLVGRIDYNFQREKRALLKDFISLSSLPLIVLDHQPQFFKEAKEAGAQLQISGHTHNGQIFPGDLVMMAYYQILYQSPSIGFHTFDSFQLAITRGYGTWGFPMRLSGASEIMTFNIRC